MKLSCRIAIGGVLSSIAMFTTVNAQMPPGPPPGMTGSTVQAKAQYPDKVEGLMDITYATLPGFRPLKLDLYRVPDAQPKPAIIFIHGGGFEVGNPRMGSPLFGPLDGLTAQVAAHGYVVASISYRMSSEAKFPAQLEDAKAAVRWVRANATKYGIDPQRIAVWGDSVGGSLAALIGTSCGVADLEGRGGNAEQSSCVKAVVDWYGVTDMNQLDAQAPANATLIHNSPDSTQSKVLGCVLHFQCPASVVSRANPIAYIDASDANVSFLIMHGDADTAVAPKQSQMLYDALRAKNIPAKLELLPGVNHNFMGGTKEQAKYILDTVFTFLGETIGGKSK